MIQIQNHQNYMMHISIQKMDVHIYGMEVVGIYLHKQELMEKTELMEFQLHGKAL